MRAPIIIPTDLTPWETNSLWWQIVPWPYSTGTAKTCAGRFDMAETWWRREWLY